MMKYIFIPILIISLFGYKCYKPTNGNWELINGDFEQDISVGWQKKAVNYAGDYEIKRQKEGDEYYCRVNKRWCGYAQLYQTLCLVNLNSSLSFRAKFSATSNHEEYAAASGLVIEYLNNSQEKLGATYFYAKTENFNQWQNSPAYHLYETSAEAWRWFSLNIKDELTNYLTGINTSEVKYLKVSLLAYCTQRSGC